MSTFPLNRLPYLLKSGIFEYSFPRELLKFLALNRELRGYVLRNGPFQRRLRTMRIMSKSADNQDTGGGFLVYHLTITLVTTDEEHEFTYMSKEQRLALMLDDKELIEMRPPKPWPLFRRLRFCPHLVVLVVEPIKRTSQPFISSLIDFLPRFGGKYLKELELDLNYHWQAAAILECCAGRVVSNFTYRCSDHARTEAEVIPHQSLTNIYRYFQYNLAECAGISLAYHQFGTSCMLMYPNLPKTNAKVISITLCNNACSQALFRSLLKDGIPSLDLSAQIRIRIRKRFDQVDVFDERQMSLRRDIGRVAEQVDDPLICEEITSKFYDDKCFLKAKGFIDSVCFHRRFSKNLRYFYHLLLFGHEFEFFIKSEQG